MVSHAHLTLALSSPKTPFQSGWPAAISIKGGGGQGEAGGEGVGREKQESRGQGEVSLSPVRQWP